LIAAPSDFVGNCGTAEIMVARCRVRPQRFLFAAIFSPLAWAQHLILILPCGYLVIRDLLTRDDQLCLRWGTIGFMFVLIWVLPPDPLPLRLSLVVLSYHADVLALLILAALTLTIRGAVVDHIDNASSSLFLTARQPP